MSHYINVSLPLSGLYKREVYSYVYRGLGGNWPATISPVSGSFEAKGKTETLNAVVSFCPSTGLCPPLGPGVLPYSLRSCGYDQHYLFTNIAVDLTSLSDRSVTRSNSVLVSCGESCLPKIKIDFANDTTGITDHKLTGPGNNSYEFTSKITGLEANTNYNYVIQALGGNWPAVMLTPMSGSFRVNDDTYILNHKLVFCPSTGVCNPSIKGYLHYDDLECFSENNLVTSIDLKITPEICDDEQFFSNQLTVYCDDCLQKPTINIPSSLIVLNGSNNNKIDINPTISGLIPGQTYSYIFNNINSTWPTVIVPRSGTFTASDEDYTFQVRAFFCPTVGLCPNTTPGLMLPYTTYSTSSNLRRELSKDLRVTNIALNITSVCDNTTYTSNPITLKCNDCLPPLKYPNVEFAATSLTLATGCCSGSYPLIATLDNVFPGDSYRYTFTSSTGNVTFVPRSGTVSFGTSGVQNINTILVNNLARDDRAIINVSVTHLDTGFSDVDFMTISCAPITCDN